MFSGYAKMQERLPDGTTMPLFDLVGPIPEEVQPLVNDLKKRLTTVNKCIVKTYYNLGRKLEQEFSGIEGQLRARASHLYGTGLMKAIAVALDVDVRLLYDCRNVAAAFSPEQYESAIVNNGLTWSHARVLTLALPPIRLGLAERTVAESLTVRELECLITEGHPRQPRGRGRTPAKPRNWKHALDKVHKSSIALQNTVDAVANGADFDLIAEIQTAVPDELDESARALLVERIGDLEKVEKSARDLRCGLAASLARVDQCIAARVAWEEGAADRDAEDRICGRSRRAE